MKRNEIERQKKAADSALDKRIQEHLQTHPELQGNYFAAMEALHLTDEGSTRTWRNAEPKNEAERNAQKYFDSVLERQRKGRR